MLNRIFRYEPETGLIYFNEGWCPIDAGQLACGARAGAGYRNVSLRGKYGGSFAAHRVAWKMLTGRDPKGVIDHINGIRDDNRAVNLRDVSPSVNAQNNHGNLWTIELDRRRAEKDNIRFDKRRDDRQKATGYVLAVMSLGG